MKRGARDDAERVPGVRRGIFERGRSHGARGERGEELRKGGREQGDGDVGVRGRSRAGFVGHRGGGHGDGGGIRGGDPGRGGG